MPSGIKSALLVGASGLVGGHCLQQLLASNDYSRVVALGRCMLDIQNPKLTQHVVNFEELPEDLFRVVDVYCCLGTTIAKAGSQDAFARVDRDYPEHIAELAFKQGAKQFLLVSSVGANPASRNFYLRTKGQVEAAVAQMGFATTHIFRPSMLLGKRNEFRWKERWSEPVTRTISWMFVGRLRKYRPIEADIVARAMVAAAGTERTGTFFYEGEQLQALGAGSSAA